MATRFIEVNQAKTTLEKLKLLTEGYALRTVSGGTFYRFNKDKDILEFYSGLEECWKSNVSVSNNLLTLVFFDEIYKIKEEPKWYEDIPACGILCWTNEKKNNITIIEVYSPEIKLVYSKNSNSYSIDRGITPLTQEELFIFSRGLK